MKPYLDFHKTDNEWVPSLPSHWKSTQLRHVARIYAGGTPDRTNLEFWRNGTVPWLNSGSVNDWKITSPSEWITEEATSGGKTRWVPSKSVLIALAGQGKTKGMVARLEIGSTCNQSMAAVVPSKKLDYRFVQFWISANYQNVRNLAGGDLRDGLNLQHIGGIHIPIPPKEEQVSIANFLDRETAAIDAFISDQEELIELLTERRTATITRAVTKGLDLNTPMKDSGNSWVGYVPSHWSVNAIKRFTFKITDGAHISPETENGVFDFVSTKDVSDSGIDFDNSLKTSPETYSYMVRTGCQPENGDVLFSKDGTVGRTVVVQGHHDFVVASSLIIIRPDNKRLDPFYLDFLCRSALIQEQVRSFVKGAGLPRLSIANLLRVVGAFPPLEEQAKIVAYLKDECCEIDAAIADAREAIALSKERRAAVISAAVTGKIDVRGLVDPATCDLEGTSVGAA